MGKHSSPRISWEKYGRFKALHTIEGLNTHSILVFPTGKEKGGEMKKIPLSTQNLKKMFQNISEH